VIDEEEDLEAELLRRLGPDVFARPALDELW